MRKMTRRFLSLVLAMLMIISQFANADMVSANEQSGEGNWVATQYFTNGDFEIGDETGWNIKFTSWEDETNYEVKVDDWASNNTTKILNFYNGMGAGNEFIMNQVIAAVPAGTYRVSFQQEGMEGTSGLSVSVADVTNTLPATTGWDAWSTVTTDAFVLAEDSDVTVTISGNVPAGYWGDFDNFVLEQYVESKVEEPTEVLKLNVQDAAFEGSLWEDGIWTITPETWGDNNVTFENFAYTADEWIKPGENQGTTSLKFWSAIAQEVTILQTVDIPAGTYKVISDFMGEKGTVQIMIGDQLGTAVAMNGFNSWLEANDTFTVTEDIKGVVIGFKLDLEAGGYGYIDSISVTEVDPNADEEKGEEVKDEVEEEDTYITGEISVEKIQNLPEDFIMGMDISSVVSLFESGVTYKDFEGNTIDNITDFCEFLAANGITHIRVRVWNNPYDAAGNGYGGGNCDVATAAEIAKGCRAAGLKMLIDFHCSDLWADPGKQQAPKAWKGYTLEQKAEAVEAFIGNALAVIDPNCETVDMVQVGNETTNSFVGVSGAANMSTLFSAGAKAVRSYNGGVKVVIHVTNPEKGNVTTWAKNLSDNGVDYDVLATSYYPYWHGTLANLESELKAVKTQYGKDVMVAETSYAYTLEDSDGHSNTVRVGNNDSSTSYPFTVQGQVNSVRDVMETVNNAGGLGVFYWESAWLTVGDITGLEGAALEAQIEANKAIWEQHGSGWASSYAGEYDAADAGVWYGGSAVDNEAMFYPDGTPTAALYVWNYVKSGAVSKYVTVEEIEALEIEVESGAVLTLPDAITVTYNVGTVEECVTWNETEAEAIDTTVSGTYTVSGTVTLSKEVNSGTYNGQTTIETTCKVIVKRPNLITDAEDAGFEKGDNYTIGGIGINLPAKDDPYKGNFSMHWYHTAEAVGTVTYDKVLTLEAGKYSAEIMTQGYSGDKVTLQILNTSDEVLFEGEATVLEDWAVWKTANVAFEVNEDTDVKVRVLVEMQAGGWGTADELYLYQESKAVDKEEPSTNVNPSINIPGNIFGNLSSGMAGNSEEKIKEAVVPAVLVSSNASVEDILEAIEDAEEINNTEESNGAESGGKKDVEVDIATENVPLAGDAEEEENDPMITIAVFAALFLSCTGLYITRKRNKITK